MANQEYGLNGLRIVITRASEQAAGVMEQVVTLGGIPCLFPSIEIAPLTSEKVTAVFRRIDVFDWLVFTSPNAVRESCNLLRNCGIEPGSLSGVVDIAVVGPQTEKALSGELLEAKIVARPANAKTLLHMLVRENVDGSSILIPGSRIARRELADGLRDAGATVSAIPVYDTRRPLSVPLREAREIRNGDADVVTFASPSAVCNFINLIGGQSLETVRIACIGDSTATVVKDYGYYPSIVPEHASMNSLLEAIARTIEEPLSKGV